MKITEINNDEDLEKALERLDEIWEKKPGDLCFEEHDLLVALIEGYEDLTVKIPQPRLIDAIRFRVEQSGGRNGELIQFINETTLNTEGLFSSLQLDIWAENNGYTKD